DAVAALAQGLGTATGDERTVLNQLAEIAEMRKGPVGELASTWLDPRLLALPARALMAPTPAELAVMSQVMLTPQVALAMNVAGAPVAVALRPEHRETVTVGTLLIRGR
ncbi:MAG TPA: hypothetical protein VD902_17985, partial [Symbiobacteriaceae bacterium]|nr:hypothetical protein [Symbiobacteriaceae bacterium]